MAIPPVPKPEQRKPPTWVSYPRPSPMLAPKELESSPPSPYSLTLASGPEGYLLGAWEQWPPSDTCYRRLDFPFSPSIPGTCKSLIPGPLPAPALSCTSLPPLSWVPGWHRCSQAGEGRMAPDIQEFWPRAVTGAQGS